MDSVLNRYLCNYCNNKLNKNEIPRTSVINGYDAGKFPQEISKLNIFSLLFIKLASSFQTHLKLGPVQSRVPGDQKMSGIKGNSVQLPIPIQHTIDDLNSNLSHNLLLDVGKHLVIYSKGKSKQMVYKNLVNIHDIKAALVWLKANNPHYAHITIPDDPENLLPVESNADSRMLNDEINGRDTASTVADSITEFITQDVYSGSEDDGMLTLDEEEYSNSESSQMLTYGMHNDSENCKMITEDVYSESMCDEFVTQDIYVDSECDIINTIDEYYASTSESITFITQDVYNDCEDSDSDIWKIACLLQVVIL